MAGSTKIPGLRTLAPFPAPWRLCALAFNSVPRPWAFANVALTPAKTVLTSIGAAMISIKAIFTSIGAVFTSIKTVSTSIKTALISIEGALISIEVVLISIEVVLISIETVLISIKVTFTSIETASTSIKMVSPCGNTAYLPINETALSENGATFGSWELVDGIWGKLPLAGVAGAGEPARWRSRRFSVALQIHVNGSALIRFHELALV